MIMSYIKIDKEMSVNEETGRIVFSNTKKKRKLGSIRELEKSFDELLNAEEGIINRYGTYKAGIDLDNSILSNAEIIEAPIQMDISVEDRKLLINQLIFYMINTVKKVHS